MKDSRMKGWNTWDTYSALTHIFLPEGYGVRIGLKEYLRGQYLQYANIGRMEEGEEKIYPGLHAYDGSYTELELEWRRIRIRVQTAAEGRNLVIKVTMLENTTRFIPSIVLEAGVFWNHLFSCQKVENTIVWKNTETDVHETVMQIIQGETVEDYYIPISSPYLAVPLNQPMYACIGTSYTVSQAENLLCKNREKLIQYGREKYREYNSAWEGMQTSLAWNLMYDALNDRVLVNVSRLWNMDRGGYAMFCWDNLFMGLMLATDDLWLGKNNIHQSLLEIEKLGFVPNGSFGNGRKSFDRSQPPVGTMCVWEIYQMDHNTEFLQENFDLLLKWNRWWDQNRRNGSMLAWGSNCYDNKWEMPGIHQLEGASLESGLDNSPMYVPEEVTFDSKQNVMNLWDVALNSLYCYDCEKLAQIAEILNREEAEELNRRAAEFKEQIPKLWNDELGITCNYRTDQNKFSDVLTPCNFYSLLTGVLTPDQIRRMMNDHFRNPDEFWGKWLLPSVARNHPMYLENNYWRGRIWAPLNFLVYMGMRQYPDLPERKILVENSLALFMQEWTEHRHVHENYNAENGYGDDVKNSDRNYAWGGLLAFMTLIEKGFVS
jgi:putative isomerase